MSLLRDFIGQPLHWKRRKILSSDYELRFDEQVLAWLTRTGMWKFRFVAAADGQQWIFKRESSWPNVCAIYPIEGDAEKARTPLASIKRKYKGGELVFYDGHSYTWSKSGFWRPTWFWTDLQGTPLLTFKPGHWLEISPTSSDLPDLILLALFGFYLIVLMEAEATAAAATAS
jgi:hypothetical protein